MLKTKWADAARLQVHADYVKGLRLHKIARIEKTILEKLDETRTIRIRGKNADDLDLEKLETLFSKQTRKVQYST